MGQIFMKKFFFTLLVLFFTCHLTVSQVTIIKGKIIDEDNQPVSYANIGIVDTQIGTASNEQGLFELLISSAPEDGILSVSAISYKNFEIKLSEITNPLSITITLEHHYIQMDEVVVTALDENARNIVRKAIANGRENYSTKPYQLKGFYRELLRNDNEYALLVEAAFTMEDNGYYNNEEKKFRLDALRKSDDMRKMDDLDIQIENRFNVNELHSIFKRDLIDSDNYFWSRPSLHSLNEAMLDNFDFLLDSMVYFDNHLVYCISFYSKNKSSVLEYNQLFIRTLDYAIIELRMRSVPREITKSNGDELGNKASLVDGKSYGNRIIKYKEYKGNWYPYLITSHTTDVGGNRHKARILAFAELQAGNTDKLDYTNTEFSGKKIDPDKNNYYHFQQVLITNVFDKKDKYKKIKISELMEKKKKLRQYKMPYSADFWKDYNKILMNPYLKTAQDHLQIIRSLEMQFQDNGRID